MLVTQATPEAEQLSFQLDSPLHGRVKNDRTVMVFNFFALIRERVTELPVYDDGQFRIEVTGTKHGVANIWDKALLIYVVSLIQSRINERKIPERRVSFTAHDFFRVCSAPSGGSAYDRLEEMLRRLQGTQIKTNIETGGEGEDRAFSWITDYKLTYNRTRDGSKRLKLVTVELCEWLFRAVVVDRRMLTYDPKYFGLGPLERRLYEIARAHCGRQGGFRIGLAKLQKKVGSVTEPKLFKRQLAKIASQSRQLPEYGFMLVDPEQARTGKPLKSHTRLKRLQVYFFPLCMIRQVQMMNEAPLIEED
jgi:plasmid replication initiation protein